MLGENYCMMGYILLSLMHAGKCMLGSNDFCIREVMLTVAHAGKHILTTACWDIMLTV